MLPKKVILHFIYSLGRGGAETMLVAALKNLKEYYNIIVILQDKNDFIEEIECDKLICLNNPSLISILLSVINLKKIIKAENVSIVHSHLPLCNFIARLATPSNIPLISTIHNSIAHSKDYQWAYLRWLDKLTYKFRGSTIIAVSNTVMFDYFSVLKLKQKNAIVLYNFVDEKKYLNISKTIHQNRAFKMISVGSLSFQKNFLFLIKTFQYLKKYNIELHIYGQGQYYNNLKSIIEETQVKVELKGQVNNIYKLLPDYDLFIMSSFFEGFSISVLEAMAAKLPLLLSDIPSFREQSQESANYFDLNEPFKLAEIIKDLKDNPKKLDDLANLGYKRLMENFTLINHMQQLKQIYNNEFQA